MDWSSTSPSSHSKMCIRDREYSDEQHILSTEKILELLKQRYHVELHRKTLGSYILAMNEFGIEISTYQENRKGYYLIRRDFEKSEIHVLCNLIHSSHFICSSHSDDLIQKLLQTQSRHQRRDFLDAVYIRNPRKTINQELFWNVEKLLEAIQHNHMISMKYLTYNLKKELTPRREKKYELHPYYIVEENGSLYVLAYTSHHPDISHYRIDRMSDIQALPSPRRKLAKSFDPYEYTKTKMYMYGGNTIRVTLRCHQKILNDIIDQFGREVILQKTTDPDYFFAILTTSRQGIIYYAMQYALHCEIMQPLDLSLIHI